MKNSKLLLLTVVLFSIIATACKKEAGEGGKASVTGSIHVQKYNTAGTFILGDYPGAYENVYIIYGDDVSYGNKVEANPEGKFEFKYLRPGHYKVYAYSKDSTGDASVSKFAVLKEVDISGKKDKVDAGTIQIYTYQ